jgi:hypothetical protein
MATLIHGQNRTDSPALNGRTVAQARGDYGRNFNIPAGAQPSVNGVNVAETYTLAAGDELVFAVPTGQKGK